MHPSSSPPFAAGTPARPGPWSWPARAESWLDARGRKAWVLATVAAFILFWPLGLALLAYVIWSKKMSSCTARRLHHHDRAARWGGGWSRGWNGPSVYTPSGNVAFDAYKDSTLKRLEEEQAAFAAFLQRLRDARDKQEFDSFMEDRARAGREAPPADPASPRDVTPGPDAPRNGDL